MKKMLCLMVVLALLLAGCTPARPRGAAPGPDVTPASTKAAESGQETPAPEETPAPAPEETEPAIDADISYAELIPDPEVIFPDKEMSILDPDSGKAYIFQLEGCGTEEYETYISLCKEMGFKDARYETKSEFGAYTQDGKYWVELLLDSETQTLVVVCQKSENYEPLE